MPNLVSVVVPFYNEEDNVPLMAEAIRGALSSCADFDYECVFVNDGSVDGTADALGKAAADDAHVRVFHLESNSGQSAALVAGMRRSQGDFIFILDGDLQNDPSDIPMMVEKLADHDCVFGYRANRRDTWVKRMSSKVANAVRDGILKDGVRDSGCGSKGFRRECIEHLISFNGQHRFFGVMMRAAGKSIAQVPVNHHERKHGVSKYGIGNRLWRGLYDLVGMAWMRRRYVAVRIEGESRGRG